MPSDSQKKNLPSSAISYLIGERLSYSTKMTILLLLVVAFPVVAQILVPFVDVESLRILTVLPVIITSAFFGAKAGLVFIVYVFVLSYVVFTALGVSIEFTTPNLIILTLALTGIGYIIGSASDYTREQKRIARSLKNRESTYRVIYNAVQQYMESGEFEQTVVDFLERLGKRIGVSRAYLFRNNFESADEKNATATQLFEWSAEGVEPQISNPDLTDMSIAGFGLTRTVEEMKERGYVIHQRSNFPKEAEAMLVNQDIYTFLLVPVFVQGRFWGFMGLDQTERERIWTDEEIEVLKLAATIIGSFVVNKEKSEQLVKTARELQDMNDVMIGRELEMNKLREKNYSPFRQYCPG
ncbi:MAG: GAF domain protein [candidate division WS6 bacterium OLB20]|uniref:GAF domain protein n=1 Tax=candidate division WS6 bacterium OLB20 TaxID=1617426 RepID=A0A136LY84_9BACT|nr:MAG: GAF domain protein [candidate division WS6 bacterium OLB20]